MTCALCGSTLTYQGLTEVYCSGPSTCPNVDKDVLAARKIEEEARNLAWPVAGPYSFLLSQEDFKFFVSLQRRGVPVRVEWVLK